MHLYRLDVGVRDLRLFKEKGFEPPNCTQAGGEACDSINTLWEAGRDPGHHSSHWGQRSRVSTCVTLEQEFWITPRLAS